MIDKITNVKTNYPNKVLKKEYSQSKYFKNSILYNSSNKITILFNIIK